MKQKSVLPLENYRRMVAQQAWRAYVMLPHQIKVWIGIEDMIEDGMGFAFRYFTKRFNPNIATFSTAFYHALHNYFIRQYVEQYGAFKRGWEVVDGKRKPIGVFSLEGMQSNLNDATSNYSNYDIASSISALQVSVDSIVENAIVECFVVPALCRVHANASERLQKEMHNWFWYKRSKEHTKSIKFKKLTGEFRELCTQEKLECNDCIHLMRSPKCLDSLSRQLLWIPYDLNNPTPGIQSSCW